MARLAPAQWFPGLGFGRRPVVGVVRLAGVIGAIGPLRGGLTLAGLAGTLERAFALRNLKAVALAVNSPGGSAVQSALIAKRIRDLAAEKSVPVVAFVEDVAASGGYWLACAADEIFADESSILGSIGVISAGFGFAALLERFGVERRVHVAGARKGMLDPFRAELPEDVARLEALQRDIHDNFKAQVRGRRGARLKADDETLFNGDIWTGRRALDLGLIDGIGDLRATLRARFGDKVRLRPVGAEGAWLRRRLRLGAAAREGGWARELVAALAERELWSRYGL
ncbi:MAG: S49 family peptidase [Dongiaceae bacterium]